MSFFNRLEFSFFIDSCQARLNSKKKHKKIKAYRKSLHKEPTVHRCLLIRNFKPFRSKAKGKHSIGREFQGLTLRGKKQLT